MGRVRFQNLRSFIPAFWDAVKIKILIWQRKQRNQSFSLAHVSQHLSAKTSTIALKHNF